MGVSRNPGVLGDKEGAKMAFIDRRYSGANIISSI